MDEIENIDEYLAGGMAYNEGEPRPDERYHPDYIRGWNAQDEANEMRKWWEGRQ